MSGLFGGGGSLPPLAPPPVPKPTPPMPDLESPGVLEAQQMQQARIMSRGGRRSTILSQGADMTPYTRPTLGVGG